MAIRSARERPRLPHKRPRDHSPHFVRPTQNIPRRLAHLVQLEQRDHFLVRRDLKHAVRRRVHNRRPGAHVFLAQLFDDFRARRRFVAERAPPDARLKRLHHLARKSFGKQRERLRQMNPRHLPMPRSRVLAGRRQRALPERPRRRSRRLQSRERPDIRQPQPAQIRQLQMPLPRDISQRVAALVAVSRRIRHFADARRCPIQSRSPVRKPIISPPARRAPLESAPPFDPQICRH